MCEGENWERLQSAQHVKELIDDHSAVLEDFSRLILKVDWETTNTHSKSVDMKRTGRNEVSYESKVGKWVSGQGRC